MASRIFMGILVLLLIWCLWPAKVRKHPNGMTVKTAPVMKMLTDGKPWNRKNYTIRPLASYKLDSRILAKARYYMGQETDLSKYDLAVGWQAMSDSRVLNALSISQGGRWYEYSWSGEPPADPGTMSAYSKNMHMIPANPDSEKALDRVVVGDLVKMEGQLVECKDSSGWTWTSSTDDNATGAHSCKVFWLESMSKL